MSENSSANDPRNPAAGANAPGYGDQGPAGAGRGDGSPDMTTDDVNADGTVGTVTKDEGKGGAQIRPDAPNLSTEHQPTGDAARPSDTLNRSNSKVHPPRDFDPVNDVGSAEPGRN